jgi:Arc/MetJ-type ribon-helix-helix transcriptional regulator
MNLEIHKPELVQRVNAHIRTGRFHDVDEVLEKALDALEEKAAAPSGEPKNLVELFAPLRGLFTDEEVDTLFSRNRSTGAGKSTITRQLDFGGKERLLDPDAVARRMAPEDVIRFLLAAGREVLSLTRQCLSAGLSFAVETTLAGKGPIKTMRRARERGFEVVLLYICLDSPERNVRRV